MNMLEDTAAKFDFAVSSEKFKYTCRRYSFLTKSAKIKLREFAQVDVNAIVSLQNRLK